MCQKFFGKTKGPEMQVALERYNRMLARELRGSSDTEAAMRRLETLYGIPYGAQWNVKYKHDRKPSKSFCERVNQVYLAFLKTKASRELETIKIEIAKGDDDADLAVLQAEAETLLAKIEARLEKVEG